MIDSEGTACVPSLIAGLKHEDSWAVNNAAECLSLIGPKAKAALPALRMAIFRPYSDRSNIDPPVSALKALVRIDPESHETMAILCQALKHRTEMGGIEEILGRKDEPSFDYSVAEAAARILGYHGPKAKSAVPALIEALHGWRNSNSHPYKVGREFVLALGLIGVNAEDAIPLLRLLAGDSLKAARPDRLGQPPSFGVVDKASAISLLSLDPESRRAAENGDPPSSDSETTAAFLVALGRPSLEAELILRREMEDIDEQIHESMIRTDIPSQLEWRYERLSRFGLASRSAIPKLKEWQKHPNPWIRLWAGEAKSRIP